MTITNISALLTGASGVTASSRKRIVLSSAAMFAGAAGMNPYTGDTLIGDAIGVPVSSFEDAPNAAFRFLLSQDSRPTSVFSGYNDQINLEVAAKALVGNAKKTRGLASSIAVVAPLKLEDNKLTYDNSDEASITNSLQFQINVLTSSLAQERAERQAEVANLTGRIDELTRSLDDVRAKLYVEVQSRVDSINSLSSTLASLDTRVSAHATVLNNYRAWWINFWTSSDPAKTIILTNGSGGLYISTPAYSGAPTWPPATVT